jgi:hypothetical protein
MTSPYFFCFNPHVLNGRKMKAWFPGSILGSRSFLLHSFYLVGGLEPWNFMTFHSVGKFIIPTDEVHHFSEG